MKDLLTRCTNTILYLCIILFGHLLAIAFSNLKHVNNRVACSALVSCGVSFAEVAVVFVGFCSTDEDDAGE